MSQTSHLLLELLALLRIQRRAGLASQVVELFLEHAVNNYNVIQVYSVGILRWAFQDGLY